MNKDIKKKASLDSTSSYYRLVHAVDIGNWKKAVDLAKRKRKRDKTGEKIRSQLRSILFTESMVLDDSQTSGFTLSRRLQCVKHGKPLLSVRCFRAIHHQTSTQSTGTTEHNQDVPLTLINEETFSKYISSMLELEQIVASDGNLRSQNFQHENYHPKLTLENTPADCEGRIDFNEFFTDSPEVVGQLLRFTQEPCDEKSCVDEYHQYFCALPLQEEEKPAEMKCAGNPVASQEIEILDDEQLNFEVHEFAGFTNDATAQAILEKCFKDELNNEAPAATNIRRSSRKRNAPSNTTFTFRCKKGDNLAQFRLRIYEQSNNIQISTHRLSVFLFNADSQEGTTMEILGSWNELRMEEVLNKFPLAIPFEETIHIVLAASNLSKKQMVSDGNDVEDDSTVLDVLAFIATGVESPKKSGKRSDKTKRNHERGFAGTFLQSSFHQSNQNIEIVDGNGIVPSNKAIEIDISDNEHDNSTSCTEAFEEDKIDKSATCAEAEGKIDKSTPCTEADEEDKIDKSATCTADFDADAEDMIDKSTPCTEADAEDKIDKSATCAEAEGKIDKSTPCTEADEEDKIDKSAACTADFDADAEDMIDKSTPCTEADAEDKIDKSATSTEADANEEDKIDKSATSTEFEADADAEDKIDESTPCTETDEEGKIDRSTPCTEADVDIDGEIDESTPCTEAEADGRNDESTPCTTEADVDDKNAKSTPCTNADDSTKLGMKAEVGINNAPITEQHSVVSSIILKVYESTDSILLPNFDTSFGKEPAITSAKGACQQFSSKDIQGIISFNSDIHKQGVESIITRLQLDPAARNIFRNFGETEVDTSSRKKKNIPISRREFDIAVYFLNTNQRAEDCQLLMPYRPKRFVSSIFNSLKKANLAPTDNAFPEYTQYVLSYVKNIYNLEKICNCEDDQK